MGEALPALLTVEEAARLLRIGRTKAYAMAREWRATDGQSGLPVVDFGHVLRVPRHQLEAVVGGPLDAVNGCGEASAEQPGRHAASQPDSVSVPGSAPAASSTDTKPASTTPTQRGTRTSSTTPARRRSRTPDHPTLPFTT